MKQAAFDLEVMEQGEINQSARECFLKGPDGDPYVVQWETVTKSAPGVEGPAGVTVEPPMSYFLHHEMTARTLVVTGNHPFWVENVGKMSTVDTAEEQIVHALDACLEYARSRPQIFEYVFPKPRDDARGYPEDFCARHSPTLNPLADAVAKWMEEGALEKDDIWEVTLAIWAHAHGYIALYRAGRFSLAPKDFKELCHRSMRRLFRGLKARDPHGPDGSASMARFGTTVLSKPPPNVALVRR
jgi:hypothetical protein